MQEEFRAFWGGPSLSAYEELSLASVIGRGHRVLLYSYDSGLRVPPGAELRPAEEIVPGPIREFVYPNGDRSIALHSDLFRYQVLRRHGGWYFDLDVVLLADELPRGDIFLARQDSEFVNGAIMKFPANHPLMVSAAEAALAGADQLEWGSIGPRLLTGLVKQHGMQRLVSPSAAAFAVQPDDVPRLFAPSHRETLEAQVAGAPFIHLWNEIWRRARVPKGYGPPEGSFLDSLFRRFRIAMPPGARLSAEAVEAWFREMHLMRAIKHRYGEDFHTREWEVGIEEALWEREHMLRSVSWKVTAPLRGLINTVRRVSAAGWRSRTARQR